MGHLKTLSMKAAANIVPVLLVLTLVAQVNWFTALIISLILTALAYFIGDMYILPRTGNVVATFADAGLAIVFLWMVNSLGIAAIGIAGVIYVAIAVALVESLFYHPFLKRLVGIDSMGPEFGKRE